MGDDRELLELAAKAALAKHVATPSSHPEIPDNSKPVARVTGYSGGRCVIDAALAAEPQQPVAYRQKVQFYATEIWCYSEERRTGYNEPLYTKLVAAQYSDLVSDGGLDPRNASDVAAPQDQDAKDAARFRWLEQNVYQGVSRFSQVLWCIRGLFGKDGESFREAIDDAMYGTKK